MRKLSENISLDFQAEAWLEWREDSSLGLIYVGAKIFSAICDVSELRFQQIPEVHVPIT